MFQITKNVLKDLKKEKDQWWKKTPQQRRDWLDKANPPEPGDYPEEEKEKKQKKQHQASEKKAAYTHKKKK